ARLRVQVDDGSRTGTEQRALVGGRQESVAPHVGAADGRATAVSENDETGKALVLASQAVRDPGADGAAAGELASGQGVVDGRTMIVVVYFDAVDERQVVGARCEIGKQIRHPAPRF